MPLVASIAFSHGSVVGTPGRAVIGPSAVAVDCSNGDDSAVVHHAWAMLEVPAGSAVPTGPFGGDNPTATFTPDVGGRCCRVQLITTDAQGNTKRDIRNYGVLDEVGILLPSFQPTAGVDYTKDEFNFAGQTRSWAKLIDNSFAALKALAQPKSGVVRLGLSSGQAGTPIHTVNAAPSGAVARVFYQVNSAFNNAATLTVSTKFGAGAPSAFVSPADCNVLIPGEREISGSFVISGSQIQIDLGGTPNTGNGIVSIFWWIPADFPAPPLFGGGGLEP